MPAREAEIEPLNCEAGGRSVNKDRDHPPEVEGNSVNMNVILHVGDNEVADDGATRSVVLPPDAELCPHLPSRLTHATSLFTNSRCEYSSPSPTRYRPLGSPGAAWANRARSNCLEKASFCISGHRVN
jgi:hypothetical protein